MKITRRIDDTPARPTDPTPGTGFSLTRRADDTPPADAPGPTTTEPGTAPATDASRPAAPATDDWQAVAQRLTQLLGPDVVERVRHYPASQIGYLPAEATANDWLMEALRTLLTLDDVQAIRQQIEQTVGGLETTVERLQATCHEQTDETDRLREQLRKAQEKAEELDALRVRNSRLLKIRVSIEAVIDLTFATGDASEQAIARLLKDDLTAYPDDLSGFVLALAAAWADLKQTIRQLSPDLSEDDRLQQLHLNLSELLRRLSGLFVPARRGVLNVVAQYASQPLTQYEFVSPEETRMVNPAIHRTDGLGASVIAEGITFAVLRRDTRQTIRYADVQVQKS